MSSSPSPTIYRGERTQRRNCCPHTIKSMALCVPRQLFTDQWLHSLQELLQFLSHVQGRNDCLKHTRWKLGGRGGNGLASYPGNARNMGLGMGLSYHYAQVTAYPGVVHQQSERFLWLLVCLHLQGTNCHRPANLSSSKTLRPGCAALKLTVSK